MPMELLRSLAEGGLPAHLDDIADIDKLRVLAAAQLVTAKLPAVQAPTVQLPTTVRATVLAITGEGRAALARQHAEFAHPHRTTLA